MKYQVIVDGKIVKEYTYRIQAVIWCFLNGHVVCGKGKNWIVGAEIREVKRH